MMNVVYIALLTVFANAVGVLSGFGIGTIMMPLLALFLPFHQTILLVAIIHWFHNIWKIIFFHHGFDKKLFLCFGLPSVVTTFIGASLVTETTDMLTSFLGVALIAYVIFLYLKPRFELPQTTTYGVLGGAISGFTAGIIGIRGAIRSAFLSAYDLPKATYLATTGAISFLVDTVRIATYYGWEGIVLEPSLTRGLFIIIPATFIGSKVAQLFVDKIPQQQFRYVIALFLLLVGIRLLLFPIG